MRKSFVIRSTDFVEFVNKILMVLYETFALNRGSFRFPVFLWNLFRGSKELKMVSRQVVVHSGTL